MFVQSLQLAWYGTHYAARIRRYDELLQTFPQSSYIVGQAATEHYNRRAFDEAQELFEKLLKEDPYRIEGKGVCE